MSVLQVKKFADSIEFLISICLQFYFTKALLTSLKNDGLL